MVKIAGSEDLAQPIDLVIIGLAGFIQPDLHLVLHEILRIAIAGDIADGEINSFLDDHLVAANIRHIDSILVLKRARALIFTFDGIHQDAIGLFREGKEAQLGVIKISLDEMELDQHLLTKQLGAIEKYFVVFEIVDVFQLERGHACFPDDFPGGSPEGYILR